MIEFDSKEELYFYWWIQELKRKGIILSFTYQPKAFELSTDYKVKITKQLKTKVKEQQQKLLSGHSYTADFIIYWNKSAKDKIFAYYATSIADNVKKYAFIANYSANKNCYFSVVDVKGNFNQNDAWRRFSINQKWVFQKYHVYVNKIIPTPQKNGLPASALFKNTFIPKRYQLTDKSGKKRKLHFKAQLIDDFLKSLNL